MIPDEVLDEMQGRAMRDMYGAYGTDVLDLVIVVRKMKDERQQIRDAMRWRGETPVTREYVDSPTVRRVLAILDRST